MRPYDISPQRNALLDLELRELEKHYPELARLIRRTLGKPTRMGAAASGRAAEAGQAGARREGT